MNRTDGGTCGRGRLPAIGAVLPVIACLSCPICLPAGLGLLSALGVGVFVSERVHGALVLVSLVVALSSAVLLARGHRNRGPVLVTLAGAAMVLAGCLVVEAPSVEYVGTASLVGAAIWNWRLRRRFIPPLFRIRPRAAVRTP
jgi:hypothetical protein